MKDFTIRNKKYDLPIYLPDATRGIVKGVDSIDLAAAKVRGVVVNTYHLMTSPGVDVLKKFGNVKGFMNFNGLVVSDSGGWQVFSLIHRSGKSGSITDEGVEFSIGGGSGQLFSPADSIKMQFEIGSDIIICLDDFTPPDATLAVASATVDRTILWAKACKREYELQLEKRGLSEEDRPHLYAVVQGGYFREERKRCAEELIEIGFDGYGFGGYVVDESGRVDLDISQFISDLLPSDKVRFALGFGRPEDLVNLRKMGWDIFDCTLPTRDARHRRLYAFTDLSKMSYEYIYISKSMYATDDTPVSTLCDCSTCRQYSKAYLRHLFRINETLALRLATIHNLRFYTMLTDLLSN